MSQLFSRERRSWTAKEDQLLRDAVQREDPDNPNPSKWHAIAKHVPNRTNKDCRKRWFAKMASDVVKGGWAPDEDEKLVKGIERYGTRWSLVASVVQTRNSDQCAKRWTDTLNPAIDRTTWTPEADDMLLRAVTEHGKVWTKIVKTYFPGRTGLSAKNRYNSITRFSSDLSRSVRPRRRSEGGASAYLPDRKAESGSSSSSSGSPVSPSLSLPFLLQSPAQPSLDNRTNQHSYLEAFSDWSSSSSMTTEDVSSLRSSPIGYDFSTSCNNLDNSYQSFDISMPSYPAYPDSSLLFSATNNAQAPHNNFYKTLSNPSHNRNHSQSHNQMHTSSQSHPAYPHYPHLAAGSFHGTTEAADRFPIIYDAIPALESGPMGNFGAHPHVDMAWGLASGNDVFGEYGMKAPSGYRHGHHGYAVRSRS